MSFLNKDIHKDHSYSCRLS